jgi:transposase
MRVIGMDIHRTFAQVAIIDCGEIIEERRVDLVRDRLLRFAEYLKRDDEVVIEATGNSAAVERLLRPYVRRVVVANPRLVKAIAWAKVKSDKVDAIMLAKLHAGGLLPEVWVADDETGIRRRQIAERMGVLAQLVRTKGRIQAILHANLIEKYEGHLFGPEGRKWLAALPLRVEERDLLHRYVMELERVTVQLSELDKTLAQQSLDDPRALRLMTIPGISSIVASTVLASIGDISRFPTPEKLSSYFGLTPRIRQSGDHPARHGTDLKARKPRCSPNACRSSLVGQAGSRTASSVLHAGAAEKGSACCSCSDGAETGGDDLAHLVDRPRLPLRQAGVHGDETEEGGFEGGSAAGLWKGRPRPRLLDQGNPRPRGPLRRARRTRVRANGRRLV